MNQDYTKLLGSILKNMALMDHIRPSEIPNIDLYMDQVTTYLNNKFNISDAYMRRFFTYYVGHEFLMQVIMGIILMVIGVILVFIISRKKFRN